MSLFVLALTRMICKLGKDVCEIGGYGFWQQMIGLVHFFRPTNLITEPFPL